jgi:hypothetical protein
MAESAVNAFRAGVWFLELITACLCRMVVGAIRAQIAFVNLVVEAHVVGHVLDWLQGLAAATDAARNR